MVRAVLSESTEVVVKSQPNPESAIKTCTSCFWSSRCHLLLLLPPSTPAVIPRGSYLGDFPVCVFMNLEICCYR